ncbi:hypothetical protein K439DRAFT_1334874 [Ramaria rubella]|nr:hypothetical protein K439DRAFT_1334874 [Ramaria rubella]
MPLDASKYNLKEDEKVFFKAQTGIDDDTELRKHILDVQAQAYAVYPYPCIHFLGFTQLKISRLPLYDTVLKLGKEREGAVLLDIGCCFGNDVRKVIADGFPRENVIASDLRAEFWTLGHQLFKSSQESFPVAFLPGDVFDPSFLSPAEALPVTASSLSPPLLPPLSCLTSLTPLRHRISVIHASSLFHLFPRHQQRVLVHKLGILLSPLPGSLIFGTHKDLPELDPARAVASNNAERNDDQRVTLGYSPIARWEEMWVGDGGVFKPEDVILKSTTADVLERDHMVKKGGDRIFTQLTWSVTRAG